MKCPKCKADVSEDSHFCSKCGMPLKESADFSVSQTRTLQKPAISAGKTLAEIEERAIREALVRNDYHRLETARELGIDKTTLWRKMKALGLAEGDLPDGRNRKG